MNRFRWIAVACLILGAASALSQAAEAQVAAPGELLANVTDDAVVIFAIASADGLKASLGEFIDGIEPGSAEEAAGAVDEMLTTTFPNTLLAGEISGSEPVIMAMYPGDDGRGGPMTAVAYFPVSDLDAVRARLGESIKTDEASGLEYIEQRWPSIDWDVEEWDTEEWDGEDWEEEGVENDMDDADESEALEEDDDFEDDEEDDDLEFADDDAEVTKVFFKRMGSYVVMSFVPERLTGADAAPLSGARCDGIVGSLRKGALAINVSFPALREGFPDLFDDLRAEMEAGLAAAGGGDPRMVAGKAIVGVYFDILNDIVDGCDNLFAAVAAGGDGISIASDLSTVAGSRFAAMFAEQGPVNLDDLALLPSRPVFVLAGGLRGEETWGYLTGLYAGVLSSLAPDEEAAGAARAAVEEAFAKVKSLGIAENMTGALMTSPDAGFQSVTLYRVADAAAAVEGLVSLTADPEFNSMWLRFTGMTDADIAPVVTAEEIGGVKVTVSTMSMEAFSQDPMVGAMMQRMFGGALVSRIAAHDGMVVAALSAAPDLMSEMLAAPDKRTDIIDKARLQDSLRVHGDTPLSAVALVSIPDYFAWIMSLMPFFGAPVDAEPPASRRMVSIGYAFEGTSLSMLVDVPMEQITATRDFFEQMTSSFAPGGGAPASMHRTANLKQLGLGIAMYQMDYDETMPPDLQTLLDDGYVKDELLFLAPTGYSAAFDKAAVDATGDYYYARVKAPAELAGPSLVAIMWEKMADTDGTVAVLWADLHASVVSADELAAAVEAAAGLYEQIPPLPAEATEFPVETDVEALE